MIVSHQNQKIKDIRRIQRCKGDRAVLEGPHLVREALQANRRIEFALATPQFATTEEGRQLLEDLGLPVSWVEPRLFEGLCDADSPRGILAVVSLPPTPVTAIPMVEEGLYLYVDGIQDPGNLGALARVFEAFAGTALALGPGTVHPNHPRALRASAGSLLRLVVCHDVPAPLLSRQLEPLSPSWVVLTPRDGMLLTEYQRSGTLVLAIGAEGPGLSATVLALADYRLTIPIARQVESLNATVAAAIALFQLSTRHRL